MSKLQKKGYTLIELLITLAIMSILFGLGFISFRNYSRIQVLRSFTRKIRSDLSLAREKAISGEKPIDVECNGTNRLDGYYLRVTADQSYVVEAVCSGGTVVVKTVPSENGLSIGIPENPIFFKALSKGTNLSSDMQITITQPSTGNTSSVLVTQSGEIK